VLRRTEAGGPSVSPPMRKGFGRTVIETMPKDHLGGDARLDRRPEGLVCEIIIPPVEKACLLRTSERSTIREYPRRQTPLTLFSDNQELTASRAVQWCVRRCPQMGVRPHPSRQPCPALVGPGRTRLRGQRSRHDWHGREIACRAGEGAHGRLCPTSGDPDVRRRIVQKILMRTSSG
jgi:hypothetical protein